MSRLIILGYVWQIWGRGVFLPPPSPIRKQPRKSPSWIGLKSGFKRTINWNTKPVFSFVNWSKFRRSKWTVSFISWSWRTKEKWQTILSPNYRNEKLQCYDWWKTFFDQPVRNNLITYDNIQKIATGQRDDYTTGCLLDYNYFKKLQDDRFR